jgi:hypothetical protein
MTNSGVVLGPAIDRARAFGQCKLITSFWKELAGILVMPIVELVAFIWWIPTKPDYGLVLFTTKTGLILFAASIGLMIMGMGLQLSWKVHCRTKGNLFLFNCMDDWIVFFYYLPFLFTVFLGPAVITTFWQRDQVEGYQAGIPDQLACPY